MIINYNDINICKLKVKDIKKINFDCGDSDLNEFILSDSYENLKNNLCIIFLCRINNDVVAYLSLSADSIRINEKLNVIYSEYPAIKIGRLAVDKKYQNRNLGSFVLKIIIGYVENIRKYVGVRFISVDSYNNHNTINFYKKNSFKTLQKNKKRTIPMYYDLND